MHTAPHIARTHCHLQTHGQNAPPAFTDGSQKLTRCVCDQSACWCMSCKSHPETIHVSQLLASVPLLEVSSMVAEVDLIPPRKLVGHVGQPAPTQWEHQHIVSIGAAGECTTPTSHLPACCTNARCKVASQQCTAIPESQVVGEAFESISKCYPLT